jgi:IS30 family transposase
LYGICNLIGDYEIDTVIGLNHVGALLTIINRKSKYAIKKKVSTKRADEVTNALIEMKLR